VEEDINLMESKKLLSEAFVDPEDGSKRINFEFNFSKIFDINKELKDQFMNGFLIFLHKSEP